MAVHRLSIDEFDEVDYDLVAIHTALEDYHLAFFINRQLPITLKRNASDISAAFRNIESTFSRFTYENPEHDIAWTLVQNKTQVPVKRKASQDLFGSGTETTANAYLIPEFRKVDYFLKIEDDTVQTANVLAKLQQLARVSAVYRIDAGQVKSKNNLIF